MTEVDSVPVIAASSWWRRLCTRPRVIAALLAGLTCAWLVVGHRSVGYARDEGIYFEASRHYAAWLVDGLSEPSRWTSSKRRDRAFRINREHPALLKLAGGISARLLAQPPTAAAVDDDDPESSSRGGWWPVLPEGSAMRLPASMLAGLGTALLFLAGTARAGVLGGLVAAGCFITLPRVWFHAGLHCFDVPVAVMILALVLVYRRSLVDPTAAKWLGPVAGVALATKHNALFAVALCVAHYYLALAWTHWRQGQRAHAKQLVSLPIVSLVVVGPLVAFALWPWLWSAPVERVGEYLAFHREHAYYNIAYLGQNHNRPPLPVSYPFVMTWATVPTAVLLLAAAGLFVGLVDDWRSGSIARVPSPSDPAPRWSSPLPSQPLSGTLVLLFAMFPLCVIAWPTVPIFGGTKHFLTAYPFFALAALTAWQRAWRLVPSSRRRFAAPLLVLVLVPSTWATVHGHPHNLSQYAPLIGGARGAADAGHCRGFWGTAALPLLDEIHSTRGRPDAMYLHDLHALAAKQYRREGRWPPQLDPSSLGRADAALLFIEDHMLRDELEIWQQLGTRRPSHMVCLDDVPLSLRYDR